MHLPDENQTLLQVRWVFAKESYHACNFCVDQASYLAVGDRTVTMVTWKRWRNDQSVKAFQENQLTCSGKDSGNLVP